MADWALWAHMPKATLREAVLLSLGLEPRPPVLTWTQYEAQRSYAEPGREFERRLMLAAAHVDPAGPLRPLGSMPFLNGAEGATVNLSEFGAWAQALGLPLPERFPRQQAPEPQAAPEPSAAPVVAESASGEPAGPPPLTTGDIAFCFDGLRWKTEEKWKAALGKGRDWIEACVAVPAGGRGRGAAPKLWNPVLLAAALVRDGHVKANSMRARFQTEPLLMPWLDAWKTYEADYLDND